MLQNPITKPSRLPRLSIITTTNNYNWIPHVPEEESSIGNPRESPFTKLLNRAEEIRQLGTEVTSAVIQSSLSNWDTLFRNHGGGFTSFTTPLTATVTTNAPAINPGSGCDCDIPSPPTPFPPLTLALGTDSPPPSSPASIAHPLQPNLSFLSLKFRSPFPTDDATEQDPIAEEPPSLVTTPSTSNSDPNTANGGGVTHYHSFPHPVFSNEFHRRRGSWIDDVVRRLGEAGRSVTGFWGVRAQGHEDCESENDGNAIFAGGRGGGDERRRRRRAFTDTGFYTRQADSERQLAVVGDVHLNVDRTTDGEEEEYGEVLTANRRRRRATSAYAWDEVGERGQRWREDTLGGGAKLFAVVVRRTRTAM